MSSAKNTRAEDPANNSDDEAEMFDPNDAAEELPEDGDAAMDSGSEDDEEDAEIGQDEIMEEIALQNDSSAHFDLHQDSIFTIAQHPTLPHIVATGGSEGDDAGGIGYVFDSTPVAKDTPVLPAGWQSNPPELVERKGIESLFKLEGHADSINALAFTLPRGEFLISGGLDGKLRAHMVAKDARKYMFLAEVSEVEEINWIIPCPNPEFPNVFALGANDGSVWVYTAVRDKDAPLQIVQSYFLHTESCTAGSWSADGKLLATVSEDGSLYVWDVFGEAAASDLTQGDSGTYVVALTALDQRFKVEGGLFSVAIAPSGSFLVVGGAGGAIKVVGLPRLSSEASTAKGGKPTQGKHTGAAVKPAVGQAGQILADLQTQGDNIETFAFAPAPLTLLAAGSVDGSIALFDSAHRFAVRRHIKEAHEDFSVVKLEFAKSGGGWLLTSCGMDGVVRRWDTRGGTGIANSGFIKEWKGHRGDGEGGGVLGFVQGDGNRIVTAGDDSISLVFDAPTS